MVNQKKPRASTLSINFIYPLSVFYRIYACSSIRKSPKKDAGNFLKHFCKEESVVFRPKMWPLYITMLNSLAAAFLIRTF